MSVFDDQMAELVDILNSQEIAAPGRLNEILLYQRARMKPGEVHSHLRCWLDRVILGVNG